MIWIISPASTPLKGEELLKKIQTLREFTREEKAIYCGYSRVMEDGSELVDIFGFIIAILKAKGIDLTQSEGDSQEIELKMVPLIV